MLLERQTLIFSNSLLLFITYEDAKKQAQKKVSMGVIGVYRLELDHLSSVEEGQSTLAGFDTVNIIHHT